MKGVVAEVAALDGNWRLTDFDNRILGKVLKLALLLRSHDAEHACRRKADFCAVISLSMQDRSIVLYHFYCFLSSVLRNDPLLCKYRNLRVGAYIVKFDPWRRKSHVAVAFERDF